MQNKANPFLDFDNTQNINLGIRRKQILMSYVIWLLSYRITGYLCGQKIYAFWHKKKTILNVCGFFRGLPFLFGEGTLPCGSVTSLLDL